MVSADLCRAEDCTNLSARDGLCWSHARRKREGASMQLAKRPATPIERVREAALTYAEVDAEDDDAFRRADDNLRKAAIAYGAREVIDRIRKGLERRRQAGLHVGRPRKVEPKAAIDAVTETGSVQKAATKLGVSRYTVGRALRLAVFGGGRLTPRRLEEEE